jgi:hypothetical protein
MGQFDTFIPQIGLPTEGNRASGESVVVKKPKTKAAAAGGSPPPKKPPKGPTGPKNTDKGDYNKNGASNGKKTGYLDKGKKN